MLKLYKVVNSQLYYHEAWCNQGVITEHWGVVGERGQTTEHIIPQGVRDGAEICLILQSAVDSGFAPIEAEDHAILIIEYSVEGFGTPQDLAKRHAVQDRMGEILGWTGLGDCDGGSIGSGTMEVCCYLVDFQTAKRVIGAELRGTEYGDYTRIYLENDVV